MDRARVGVALGVAVFASAGCQGGRWGWPASRSGESAEASPASQPAAVDVTVASAASDAPAARPAALTPPSAGSVLPSVLVINNDTITVNDILEPIQPRLERAARELPRDAYYELLFATIRRELVDEVSERLVWQEASRDLKGEEAQNRLEKAIDRLEQDRVNTDFGGRQTRYEKYLKDNGRSRDEIRQKLKRRLVVEQYLRDRLLSRVAIRKRDLLKYYEEHRADFTEPRTVELFLIEAPLRQFFRGYGPPTDEEKAAAARAAREHLQRALARIRAGEAFEAVARSECRGLHAEDGGAWGPISAPLRGPYEAPSKLALQMPEGQISDIVETPMALFIVKAGRVQGGITRPFEEVQSEIGSRLQAEQFADLRMKFVQRRLEQASVGDLEPFVRAVVARAPESGRLRPTTVEPDSRLSATRRATAGGSINRD